jgi:hypothetical protein
MMSVEVSGLFGLIVLVLNVMAIVKTIQSGYRPAPAQER